MDLWQAIREHWMWAILMGAVVAWYSTVTVYVAIRGVMDIRGMLERLKNAQDSESPAEGEGPAA